MMNVHGDGRGRVATARGPARRQARGIALGLALGAAGCGSDSKKPDPDPAPSASVDAGAQVAASDASTGPVAQVHDDAICGPGGWCWDNPTGPQGNGLLALDASSLADVWVVGEHGVAMHHDGERWQSRWTPTSESLRGVYVAEDEVWAVGDASTVLRFDGQAWQAIEVPGLDEAVTLRGVTGRGGDVWIVGDAATLLERRAGSWQRVAVPELTTNLNAVWAREGEVWVVGDAGGVLRHDGSDWLRVPAGTARDLFAVHGTADSVWQVGAQGEIWSWDAEGEVWQRPPAGSEGTRARGDLRAVFATPDDQVYAVGSDGTIFFWDGTAICPVEGDAGAPPEPCPGWGAARASGQDASLFGLFVAGDQALAVGDQGAIVRFDGRTRTIESEASLDNFLAVSGAGSSVWLAGDRLLRRDADRWREVERDSPRALYAVQPFDDRLMVAGTGGLVRRYADGAWEGMDVRADAWLRGLWSDGQTGWLVGSRGYAWGLLNGNLWTELETPTNADLLDVWATESGTAWAVGEGGVILRHDGRIWASIPSGSGGGVDVDLRAIWGTDDDLWAVGTGGAALHWDGTLWRRVSEEASFSLNDVWGRASDEVWAVGTGGTILRYDGSEWQPEASGTHHALNAVWGDGERVWVAGERGTVLVKTLD